MNKAKSQQLRGYLKLILALVCSVCSLAFSETVSTWNPIDLIYRYPSKTLGKDSLEMNSQSIYFKTDKHFDDYGVPQSLSVGEKYQSLSETLSATYGVTSQLELGGGVTYGGAQSTSRNSSTGMMERAKNQGHESFSVKAKYYIPTQYINWALEVMYRGQMSKADEYPAGSAAVSEGPLAIADRFNTVGAGVYASVENSEHWGVGAHAHYLMNDNKSSSAVNYGIEAFSRLTSLNTGLFVGFDGLYSLQNDQYSSKPETRPIINRGATYSINALNPAYNSVYGGLSYLFSKSWQTQLRYRKIYQGRSTDGGDEVMLTLSLRSLGKSYAELKNESFKEYEIEASVIKISPEQIFASIDKGRDSGITNGMMMDLFEFDYLGGNILVAAGKVIETSRDHAILKIVQKYRSINVKIGFVARSKN